MEYKIFLTHSKDYKRLKECLAEVNEFCGGDDECIDVKSIIPLVMDGYTIGFTVFYEEDE